MSGANEPYYSYPIQVPALKMEEIKRLLAGSFGEELHRLVASYMTFIAFGTVGSGDELPNFQSATCFFMKTPKRIFAVTAKHVVEGFISARKRDPATICQIGNLSIDLEERVIALGRAADIATFDINEEELIKLKKNPITLWPPHPPEFHDTGVLLAGYPAAAITADDLSTRCFGIYAATGIAQNVTDRQLSCKIEWENTQQSTLGTLPPKNYDTGGMSGGPVLTIRGNTLMSFPLAGVISEGRSATDTIIAERADCILADGLIRS